jgi:hypothetical protein
LQGLQSHADSANSKLFPKQELNPMKTLPLLLVMVVAAASASAQGTIHLANNAGTRFRVNGVIPANTSSGGPVPGTYNFGVFAGTTADNLSLQPVLWMNTSTGGIIGGPNVQAYPVAGFEPGSTAFIQIRGWESRFGTDWELARSEGLFGETDIKPFTLGPEGGPGATIWSSTDPAAFQSINLVPEPSAIALMGLGLGALLLFRRRRPGS